MHAATTVRKDVILAIELTQSAFSRAAQRRHRSHGAKLAKRYRIIYPSSGLKGFGKHFHHEVIMKGEDLMRTWEKVRGGLSLC